MSSSEVLAAVADLETALVGVRKRLDDGAWQLSDGEVLELTRRHHVVSAQLASVGLNLVREVESRGVATARGATSTQALLSGMLKISPGAALTQTRVADALGSRYPETGAALAEGAVCFEQAAAIVRMCDQLPAKATIEDKAAAQRILLDHTGALNAKDLLRLSKRLDDAVDPDGTEDRDEGARGKRAANFRDHHDGTQTLTWRDTDATMAAVKAAVLALAAPAPERDGAKDERSAEARRADAVRDLIGCGLRYGEHPVSRGERPHLHLTVPAVELTGRAGGAFGVTDTGEDLTIATIRRVACDGDISVIAIDPNGVPLDVGRRERTVTPAIWRALVTRDTGCVFPACTRPAVMTDAHHIIWWSEHGVTSLDNCALLCGHHHDDITTAGGPSNWGLTAGPGCGRRLGSTSSNPGCATPTGTHYLTSRSIPSRTASLPTQVPVPDPHRPRAPRSVWPPTSG